MALNRSLGPTQLIFYGVGTIVGAGIYSVIGVAAAQVGHALWLSFALASVAAFLTALSYAELSSMLPKAGAEYQFFKRAFPTLPWLASAAGMLIALTASATAATVALSFSGYLSAFISLPTLPVAIGLLAACTALNIAGLRQATWVSITLVCIEVGGLLVLIGGGLVEGEPGNALALPSADDLGPVFATTALAFFVYIGFQDIANLSEEAKQPTRDVPRALIVSVLGTAVIYLLVIWTTLSLVPAEALGASQSPLTLAAAEIAPWARTTLTIAALVATTSTALITLISISRLLFGMARDGDLPSSLSQILPGRKTPWVAALALFGAAIALLPMGGIKQTASVSSLAILLVFIGVHTAVIVLRLRERKRDRPFELKPALGPIPISAVLGALCCLGLISQFELMSYLIVGGVIVSAVLVHAIMRRTGNKDQA